MQHYNLESCIRNPAPERRGAPRLSFVLHAQFDCGAERGLEPLSTCMVISDHPPSLLTNKVLLASYK
jgi:hypothetical protein